MSGPNCAGHAPLADQLREYVGGLLDRLEPLVEHIREQSTDAVSPELSGCEACPLCALITVLRGERSELAARLAEPAGEMLAVLRAALDEGVGARSSADAGAGASSDFVPTDRSTRAEAGTPGRRAPRVQRITVARDRPSPSVRPC